MREWRPYSHDLTMIFNGRTFGGIYLKRGISSNPDHVPEQTSEISRLSFATGLCGVGSARPLLGARC